MVAASAIGIGALGCCAATLVSRAVAQEAAEAPVQEFSTANGTIYSAALVAYTANNYQGALTELNKLTGKQLNPYEAGQVYKLRGICNFQLQQTQAAADDFQKALESGGLTAAENLELRNNIGRLYLAAGQFQKGIDSLEAWIRSGGQADDKVLYPLSIAYYRVGNIPKATENAEAVLRAQGAKPTRELLDFLNVLYVEGGPSKRRERAALLERMLDLFPNDKNLWDAVAALYFDANDERRAFEVVKLAYLAGLKTSEQEIKQIVNFYSNFNAPFAAARLLEKEMNANRVQTNLDNLLLLANLYQVAREFDRSIPVLQRASQLSNNGALSERLGRSLFEEAKYREAIAAFRDAINRGGLQDLGNAWVLTGNAYYELDNRDEARKAFAEAARVGNNASKVAARGWIDFMDNEEKLSTAVRQLEADLAAQRAAGEKERCEKLKVLGDTDPKCDAILAAGN